MSEDDVADDDDWFERAIAEDGESGEPAVDERSAGDGEESLPPTASDDAEDADVDELDAAFEAAESAVAEEGNGDGSTEGGNGAISGGADTSAEEDASFAAVSDDHSFGRDTESDPIEADDAGDPFEGEERSGQFEGDEGELFDDDFAAAFGGGDGDDEFDDEGFESAIPRLDLGIEGLDGMIQGGVPLRHLMVAIGSAGTGKTTFGLQYLNHGLENGENGVFITLEQSHESIIATAAEHGWEFEAYEDEDRLAIVDLDPIEMANSLDNIRGELPALVEEFDADRFVLDSVSLLEMMYDDQAKRRTEVFDFTRSLKRAGVTTLLTSEADENNPYASRHGIIEYLTDAVFVLRYVRGDTEETRLAVEIQKIRNANHSRATKPYEITDDGISVYQQANIF